MKKLAELAYSWIYFVRKVLHFSISISPFDLSLNMQNLWGREIKQQDGSGLGVGAPGGKGLKGVSSIALNLQL